jgi:nicotinate-nucleotide adenylyltransferase
VGALLDGRLVVEAKVNIAVYGGSFDPPHLGHVMVVSHLLLNDPSVDKVLIVPCFQQAGKDLQDFEHRMEMYFWAFEWLPDRVLVSDIEEELGGESVTLRTMQELKRRNPEWSLRFVMGTDLLDSCKTWDGWDELEKIAPPMPIGRAGISPVQEGDPTPIAPVVSSSIVRKALAAGDYAAAERYLPSGVLRLIQSRRLYLASSPGLEPVRADLVEGKIG